MLVWERAFVERAVVVLVAKTEVVANALMNALLKNAADAACVPMRVATEATAAARKPKRISAFFIRVEREERNKL